MPKRLTAIDAVGIHWHQCLIHIVRRFWREETVTHEEWSEVLAIAVLHALRDVTIVGEFSQERLRQAWLAIRDWSRDRYAPAHDAMAEAFRVGPQDGEWQYRTGLQFEPAFTDMLLTIDQGFIDPDKHRESAGLALAMHSEDTLRPHEYSALSRADLRELVAHFCDQYPLWRNNVDGTVALDPKKLKAALDSTSGKPLRARGAEAEPELGETDPALEALEKVDTVRALQTVIRLRLSSAKPQSARWHVLSEFDALAGHEISLRALGQRTGFSASALQEAYDAERRAIRAAMRAG